MPSRRNDAIQVNAWEFETDAQMLCALAGNSTHEEVARDRIERAQEMIRTCSISPDKVGFEIGSGTGIVAKLLSPHCAQLDCNDISESFLKIAKATCADCPNVKFHHLTGQYLQHLPADAFDFGFSLSVFIHFNPYDIYNYLVDVRRILKPSGIFSFDACTIAAPTLSLFKESAAIYRELPQNIRGLLNFNAPRVITTIVHEANPELSDKSAIAGPGWLKCVVVRPHARR